MIELKKPIETYIAPEVEILCFKALERMASGNIDDPNGGGGIDIETDKFISDKFVDEGE